jgi:hypothetical protein
MTLTTELGENIQAEWLMCKIWGFHGGDYDDYHLPEDDNHQSGYCSCSEASSLEYRQETDYPKWMFS